MNNNNNVDNSFYFDFFCMRNNQWQSQYIPSQNDADKTMLDIVYPFLQDEFEDLQKANVTARFKLSCNRNKILWAQIVQPLLGRKQSFVVDELKKNERRSSDRSSSIKRELDNDTTEGANTPQSFNSTKAKRNMRKRSSSSSSNNSNFAPSNEEKTTADSDVDMHDVENNQNRSSSHQSSNSFENHKQSQSQSSTSHLTINLPNEIKLARNQASAAEIKLEKIENCVLIIVPMIIEYQWLLQMLTQKKIEWEDIMSGIYVFAKFRLGKLTCFAYCMNVSGVTPTASIVQGLIPVVKPTYVILVGIAGAGLDNKVGDVILPSSVFNYLYQTSIEDCDVEDLVQANKQSDSQSRKFTIAARISSVSQQFQIPRNKRISNMLAQFQTTADFTVWKQQCDNRRPKLDDQLVIVRLCVRGVNRPWHLSTDPLACGDMVIKSDIFRQFLQRSTRKFSGCAMEDSGMLSAFNYALGDFSDIEILIVRGISDSATSDKTKLDHLSLDNPDALREWAMLNAASFAIDYLIWFEKMLGQRTI